MADYVRPRALLAHVLREGRFLTGESPEQVAASLDLGNRTVRRLEAGDVRHPRALTLDALASYYALDAMFLKWLAERTSAGEALVEELRGWAREAGLTLTETRPQHLALLLARAGGAHRIPPARRDDSIIAQLRSLDRQRQAIVSAVVQQLYLAQCEERRRREGADSPLRNEVKD